MPMGPVLVVVGHEHLENTLKVLSVQNQHPVETFRAGRAHKPLTVPSRAHVLERLAASAFLPQPRLDRPRQRL
jgi:hypothetical protein